MANPIEEFVGRWTGKGYEKGETQKFWIDLVQSCFWKEIPTPEQGGAPSLFQFEEQAKGAGKSTKFIDAYLPATKVLIEQKGDKIRLDAPAAQSDGSMLTPIEQARSYAARLDKKDQPDWIITCNFREFRIYNENDKKADPEIIVLHELPKEFNRLRILVQPGYEFVRKEEEVSTRAAELIGLVRDSLEKCYAQPDNKEPQAMLNRLCVRLVFCLYAEDAGVFPIHQQFYTYLHKFEPEYANMALERLFTVLNTPDEQRAALNINKELEAFPYVNGGLFAGYGVQNTGDPIPVFSKQALDTLLENASKDFDWSPINPTIFGAMFESTLNKETRREGGMHYTSRENIRKVIDPLFLDDLEAALAEVKKIADWRKRRREAMRFRERLASMRFLDPACGSGNFLTETYLNLRRLENDALELEQAGQMQFGTEGLSPIRVDIGQFYGIEINDFAVAVARTALWIAESQMWKRTANIVGEINVDDFLPLRTEAHIVEGNALRMDWNTVCPKEQLTYIMGNPPFVGFTYMSANQKKDMDILFPRIKNLDFVAGWYKKSSDFIEGTNIECAFVSTNSITQGETVARLWPLINIKIRFAYRSFVWDSDSKDKAHVHCVIIGFSSTPSAAEKTIFTTNRVVASTVKEEPKKKAKTKKQSKYTYVTIAETVKNINAYLLDSEDVIITSRTKPLCDIPPMIYGNKPADGGHLIIEAEDYDDFIKHEPKALEWIKPLLGAEEFIRNKKRWCLWLVDASPESISQLPLVKARVQKCKEMRENSIAAAIRAFAKTPTLFAQITQPVDKPFIIVPRVSSERRVYIPISFIEAGTIASDSVQAISSATLYHFGVLTSSTHNGWMRAVCGRLKSDYRYSKDIVYNNFIWPDVPEEQRAAIEQTAQGILDARAAHPGDSLATLYDPDKMPEDLRAAHTANDRAVIAAYGWPANITEPEIVAALMQLYQQKTKQ